VVTNARWNQLFGTRVTFKVTVTYALDARLVKATVVALEKPHDLQFEVPPTAVEVHIIALLAVLPAAPDPKSGMLNQPSRVYAPLRSIAVAELAP
jgi:hypothetical protein